MGIIPVVYLTAWIYLYEIGGLANRAKLEKKPTVLIHVATGGVGQAAIQLAQRECVEIFITAGSIEKRDFLEKNIGVLRMTPNRGVDVVINSLAGDALRASRELVAPSGAFAEIDLADNEGAGRLAWQHEPMYNHTDLLRNGADNVDGSSRNRDSCTRSKPDLIAAAISLEEVEQMVLKALLDQLTETLSYDLEELDTDRSLNAYGVDSLSFVEIRPWMTKEIGADVFVSDSTNGQSIGQLAAKASARSRFLPLVKRVENVAGA
ncbi:hypothetical protein COCMIDRAFT_8620 [Bipolaris oryzae ATCC 44560]|uniref:Carrier domain-containing protein n=1 Tax=Bipolaris oryzae ATCC 44560 TaxID=930090 RepID=W6YVY9_COCMI|nr:uncharacterized protein COCMIDRAFT_8620 [Bipolaris oryzae ATCC 44560]EUC41693.1 hypothetical protein COCMIDRAFT_8620 [Bipolaris oryzae ATCC 44560]